MHHIITLNIGDKYAHAYTINLWHAVQRRVTNRPYRFICYTDRPTAVPSYIETRPVPHNYYNGWWSKLMLFDDPDIPDHATVTFLDLDLLLGPGFEKMLELQNGENFKILNNFAKLGQTYQFGSGVMTWRYGLFRPISKGFLDGQENAHKVHSGDQDVLQAVFSKWQWKYTYFDTARALSWKWAATFPEDWHIIAFHGQPSPLEALKNPITSASNIKRDILADHWKPSLQLQTYKNAYAGRRAELLLTGPSLARYTQDPSMVTFGVNSILFEDTWQLDHYLIQDAGQKSNPRSYAASPDTYNNFIPNVAKWFGDFGFCSDVDQVAGGLVPTHTSSLIRKNGFVHEDPNTAPEFATEPPFATRNSVAFTALQMMVYMGIREIHVIGADLQGGRIGQPETVGHLDPITDILKTAWGDAYNFCEAHHVRLIIVNPVGLKDRGFLEHPTPEALHSNHLPSPPPQAELCASAPLRETSLSNSCPCRDQLTQLLPQDKDLIGVELGVASGAYSETLLDSHPRLTLVHIDKWNDHHDLKEKAIAAALLKPFGLRSEIWHTTFHQAATKVIDASLDFIYIDGYAHTGQDNGNTLAEWWPKLKQGGLFAGHDYDPKAWPQTVQTVDAFAKQVGVTNIGLTKSDQYPSWYWIKTTLCASSREQLVRSPSPISSPQAKSPPPQAEISQYMEGDAIGAFHVLGPPYAATSEKYLLCAYTQKVLKWCRMMEPYGWEIHHYGHPDHQLPDTVIHHDVITDQDWKDAGLLDRGDWRDVFFDAQNKKIENIYNTRTNEILKRIARPKDHILHFWSGTRAASRGIQDVQVVEPGIGYNTTFATFKIYESYAIRNNGHGLREAKEGRDLDPWMMDTVIPNYFDPKDFTVGEGGGGYYLYLGRVIRRKGMQIIARLAQDHPQKDFIIAGQGKLQKALPPGFQIPSNIQEIGYVDLEARRKLLTDAKACLVPTLYNEPFGGVAVEAMLSGTPVITSDNGAFPETVQEGFSGMRCRNYAEYLGAIRKIGALNRDQVAEHAEKYLFQNIAPLYEDYFTWLHHLAHDTKRRWWTPAWEHDPNKSNS